MNNVYLLERVSLQSAGEIQPGVLGRASHGNRTPYLARTGNADIRIMLLTSHTCGPGPLSIAMLIAVALSCYMM